MKWNLSFPKSPMPMYYLAKVCGLAPITLKNGRFYSGTFLHKVYPLSLAALYLFMSAFLSQRCLKRVADNPLRLPFNNNYIIFYTCTTNLITASMLITCVLMCDRVANFLNKMCSMNIELSRFGIQEDSENILRNIFKTTIVANGGICAIVVVRSLLVGEITIALSLKGGREIVSANMILAFVCVMNCMKNRFVMVNEKFSNVFEELEQERLPRQEMRSNMLEFSDDIDVDVTTNSNLIDFEGIRKIGDLRDELWDLVKETTYIFGVPIVLMIFETFLSIVRQLYWFYYILNFSSNWKTGDTLTSLYIYFMYNLIYSVMHCVKLLAVCHICEETCKEINAIKLVLSQVWNKFRPMELENEFVMFSLQLLHNQHTISACGFFDLNYSTLYKISGAVITYFVIMTQFHISP